MKQVSVLVGVGRLLHIAGYEFQHLFYLGSNDALSLFWCHQQDLACGCIGHSR
ncbi:hypothetical protein L6467_12795 [Segatella bryantii]|uniref:hypothetical protein n=1 Tax=Segatella bryantii TaxID=77095 RepID=UPI001EDB64F1|nr:hypothetical protein [Segatella bryantii]UKK73410.1 hypothetical protein L6467_12795 [Segatella bryantii]